MKTLKKIGICIVLMLYLVQCSKNETVVEEYEGAPKVNILSGDQVPMAIQGESGDYYLDVVHLHLYGPKTVTGWGTAIDLKGLMGDKGPNGDPGVKGPSGDPGAKGPSGDPGVKGPNGDLGVKGPNGDPGVKGPNGDPGAKGPNGDPGAKGSNGDPGAKGSNGDPGAKGPNGDPGAKGPNGDPGAKGPNGDLGAKGKSTYIYTGVTPPSVTKGRLGDWYVDVLGARLYGPKTDNGWGTGISLLSILSIDTTQIELGIDTTKKVKINRGSGSYTIAIAHPSLASATLNTSKTPAEITIKGIKSGTTTLTVTDTRSHQTQKVTVKVIEDALTLNVEELITEVGLIREATIVKGYGPFTQQLSKVGIAQVTIEDKKIKIKGLTVGTTVATFTDTKTAKTQSLTIKVVMPQTSLPPGVEIDQYSGTLRKWPCEAIPPSGHITLPSGIKEISQTVFQNCLALKSIEIPEGVTGIRSSAFNGCKNLVSVTLPSTLQDVGSYAFARCGFSTITLPEKMAISNGAFAYCKNLISIHIPVACLFDGSTGSYIWGEAFQGCENLKTVTIAEGIKTIGYSVFADCKNLTSVKLPSTIKQLEVSWPFSGVFENCESLKTIELPEGIEAINDAFINTGITSITFPNSLAKNLEYYRTTLQGCKNLTTVVFPNAQKKLNHGFFQNCEKLSSVTLSAQLEEIGDRAFDGCKMLRTIHLPNTLKEIGSFAFSKTGLIGIVIPEGVTSLSYTFEDCKDLTSVSLPNSLKEIGYRTFYRCSSLTTLTIPKNVTKIYDPSSALNLDRLKTLIMTPITPPILTDRMWSNVPGFTIKVPAASLEAYKKAEGWKQYADKIVPM